MIYSFDPKSSKLIRLINKQINSYTNLKKYTESNEITNNYQGLINNEINKNIKELLFLQIFDTETENFYEYRIPNKTLNLRGMSQIFLENKLFIFGSPTKTSIDSIINYENSDKNKLLRKKTTDKNNFSSSFIYSINILSLPLKINYEVNSFFVHYYPTLSILRNELIIAIGGYGSKNCEYYNQTSKKWKELPELPEERFGCSSICDNTSNCIYCFGGYNSNYKKNCLSIFKLNINNPIKWDTLLVMDNSEKLGKNFSCVIKKDNGHWIIIGGNNDDKKATDNIIDVNVINSRKIEVKEGGYKEINSNIMFENLRLGCENLNGDMYLFDDLENNYVYKIGIDYTSVIKLPENIE